MAGVEDGVRRHYAGFGVLDRIRDGLAAAGLDLDRLTPADLRPVDEFHIGGGAATQALLDGLDLPPGLSVLDIGCGIGGPARALALRGAGDVTGVDLTPDFVETARALSAMVGLADRTRFEVASALDLPFEADRFDLALLLHVGMNIPDKAALFSQAYRVLKPGGTFAVYDVMLTGEGAPTYPVPWAETADLSHLAPPAHYRRHGEAAGFTLLRESVHRERALAFFAALKAQAKAAAPALGLHLLMGPTIREKSANMISAIDAGTLAPVEMIFRVPATKG
ncbi:class I SAM-dependent methyltransferase [Aurantimonas sp. Leaf443]|uniref:class I SAM-dependent methyltransferase n=1 Tax=Aurantimonas sp. Leaf443 TaxID=1736378 RepID=UPI000B0FF8EB|nr:class I SAM-dependent methyltransferase [Aurantimonas sp. Leaf443]